MGSGMLRLGAPACRTPAVVRDVLVGVRGGLPWRSSAALLSGCAIFTQTARGFTFEDALSFEVGKVLVQPRLALSETYNDNIFFRPSKPMPGIPDLGVEDDLVTGLGPGFSLQVGRDEATNFNLDYGFTQLLYADNSEQNASEHALTLRSRYAGKKLYITGQDSLEYLTSIYGGGWTLGMRMDRVVVNDSWTVDYRVTEKTRAYTRVDFYYFDILDEVPLYDQNTLRGTLGGGYQYSPKLGFFSEAYYGQSAGDPNSPQQLKGPYTWVVGGFLGANGEFTAKMAGTVKVGYEARGYGDGTEAPAGVVAEGTLLRRFGEKTSASLKYRRSTYLSVQFARFSYVRDEIGFSFDQMLGSSGRWMTRADARYYWDNYDPVAAQPDRNDQQLDVNLSLGYQIKLWMVASLNYGFERFSSNVQGIVDYNVNRITVQLSIGY